MGIRLSEYQDEGYQINRQSANKCLMSWYPGAHYLVPWFPDSLSLNGKYSPE